MADKKNYYEQMGIEQDASLEEIKQVYRSLAKKYHPDTNNNDPDVAETFKRLNEMYEVLSDEVKRAAYDKSIYKYVSKLRAPCTNLDGSGIYLDEYDLLVPEERLESGGGDILVDIICLPPELVTGTTKEVKFNRKEVCDACKGSGAKQVGACEICNHTGKLKFYMDTENGTETAVRVCKTCHGSGVRIVKYCPKCEGKGMRLVPVALKVPVMKDSHNGSKMVKRGMGHQWRDGKRAAGDLRFTIKLPSLRK